MVVCVQFEFIAETVEHGTRKELWECEDEREIMWRNASFHRHVPTSTAEGYFYCQVLCKLWRASPITDIYGTQIETEKWYGIPRGPIHS